jgi:DNA mismatch repair ATPase MutS
MFLKRNACFGRIRQAQWVRDGQHPLRDIPRFDRHIKSMAQVQTSSDLSVCSFCWKDGALGVGHYETIHGSFSIATFQPDEFATIVENVMTLFSPSHFLVAFNSPDDAARILGEPRGPKLVIRKPSDFSFKGGLEAINSLFFTVPQEEQDEIRRAAASNILEISSRAVIGAIGSIIQFVGSGSDDSEGRTVTISSFKLLDLPHGLVVSPRSMRELQILCDDSHPSIHNPAPSKDGLSLFTYVNRCSTAIGRATLRRWFLMTNSSMDEIHNRLDILEHFVRPKMHPFVNELTSKLVRLPEIRHLLVRLQKGTMTQAQWQRLHKAMIQASEICDQISKSRLLRDFELFSVLDASQSNDLESLGHVIEATIDLKSSQKDICVRGECDSQLAEVRRNYHDLDEMMTKVARALLRSLPAHSPISALSVIYVPHQGFLTTIPRAGQVT